MADVELVTVTPEATALDVPAPDETDGREDVYDAVVTELDGTTFRVEGPEATGDGSDTTDRPSNSNPSFDGAAVPKDGVVTNHGTGTDYRVLYLDPEPDVAISSGGFVVMTLRFDSGAKYTYMVGYR